MHRALAIVAAAAALFGGHKLAAQAFAPAGSLTFEVASIKPSQPGIQGGEVRPAPGGRRYVGVNLPLTSYLYVAYQVKPEQITGGPGWVATEPYDLNAEAETPSGIEDLHIMLQNILTERFKLRFHYETTDMLAYILTVDKGGSKNLNVRPAASGGDVFLDRTKEEHGPEKWNAHCASMDFFIWRLSAWFDRPFINQTSLEGCFDFALTFAREPPLAAAPQGNVPNDLASLDASGPTIFEALPRQLGLKLESRKAPVQTLVIDHAERPVEN
jgi:uncharacterized protein (TIGR03435 family)